MHDDENPKERYAAAVRRAYFVYRYVSQGEELFRPGGPLVVRRLSSRILYRGVLPIIATHREQGAKILNIAQ